MVASRPQDAHPQDGIDPLRIIGRTLALYRDNLALLVAIGATVFVPLALVRLALGLLGWTGLALATILNLAAIFIVQGAIVTAIQALRAGARPSLRVVFGQAPEWFVPLAAAGTLAALGIIVGLMALVVPGLVLLTWWLVLSPVIVIERPGVIDGFGRSRQLVIGHSWPVFTVALLTMLIQLGLSLALAFATAPLGGTSVELVGVALGTSVAAPLAATAWTLTYFDLRALKPRTDPFHPNHGALT